jgi:ribonuclease HI
VAVIFKRITIMLVTLNTDASFHYQLKYGAYAFWAVSNQFKITKSGVFKSKCINPDDAEAKCIINALKIVLLAHNGITKVIVNTDSLNAIALLKYDKVHMKKYMGNNMKMWSHIRGAYNKVLHESKNKAVIEFRHVKAHTGINDKRSYVNDWCDSDAKKQLRRVSA